MAMEPTDPDPRSDFEGALRLIAETPLVLGRLLATLPDGWLAGDPAGTWGPREVVEHLLDTEGVAFVERIRRIVEETDPFIRSIDPSARLEEAGRAGRPLEELLEEFQQRRSENVAWVRGFSDAELRRTGTHNVVGTISARELVHYWATHDLVHLGQLIRAIRSHLEPHIGAMEKFLEE
jgi:hypothetical protein